MRITAIDIQEQRFTTRFRGFDVREVDDFLEVVAASVDEMEQRLKRLAHENHLLRGELESQGGQGDLLEKILQNTQNLMSEMRVSARSGAPGGTPVDGEEMVSMEMAAAHEKLNALKQEIVRLKGERQRILFEIRSLIDHFSQWLDLHQDEMRVKEAEPSPAFDGNPDEEAAPARHAESEGGGVEVLRTDP